jgi:enediyne biosynthesis protein E4
VRLASLVVVGAVLLCSLGTLRVTSSEHVVFSNLQPRSGIDFRLENSPSAERFLIETMTGGCAFLDFDGDGLLDIFLVNGAAIHTQPGRGPIIDKSEPRYWNRLYRNLGGGRFEDVTEKAGVKGRGFGLGVAVGDYDNDGRPDLYVTNYGQNELLHNEGNGTFKEVTLAAGVAAGGFSTSAAFVDYNRDGLLDLFVSRYVDWSFENNKHCGVGGARDYCSPRDFGGVQNLLFRNNGDGTFTDVSKETGVGLVSGKGLGIAINDFDRDGWPDIYVANDQVPSFLLHNRQGKSFEEIGLRSATGLNENGAAFAGMGVDFADYDNDGWPDIFVTALSLEGYVLFHNSRDGTFEDVSEKTGVKKASFYLSGWGTKLVDFDNDGWKDLFVANGHVMRGIQGTLRTLSYDQPLLMLRNEEGLFRDVSADMGPVFRQPWAARGAAFGDFNNDGSVDVLVQVLGKPPLLLENSAESKNHWLGLQLVGTKSNRDAIGARVKVTDRKGREQYFFVSRSSSYLSSSDPRIIAGLKESTEAKVEIVWPSGLEQLIPQVLSDRYTRIVEDAVGARLLTTTPAGKGKRLGPNR